MLASPPKKQAKHWRLPITNSRENEQRNGLPPGFNLRTNPQNGHQLRGKTTESCLRVSLKPPSPPKKSQDLGRKNITTKPLQEATPNPQLPKPPPLPPRRSARAAWWPPGARATRALLPDFAPLTSLEARDSRCRRGARDDLWGLLQAF